MSMRKRLLGALGANLTTQVIVASTQIISLPVFLQVWTLEKYGQWLILVAMPTYFSLADFGFLAVTINKMTMLSASGNDARVNVLFQSALKLWLYVLIGVLLISCAICSILVNSPFDSFQNKLALVILAVCAIISMSSALVDAVFRSQGQFAFGTQLGNASRVIEWVGLLAGLAIGETFLSAAVGQLVSTVLAFFLKWWISAVKHPKIRWRISSASNQELRELFQPALAFMAFPIGNAISIQGMTLIVGNLFGPTFLVLFNSYRTIARIQTQAVTLVSRSVWPEISRQFGAGNFSAIFTLTMRGTWFSIGIALMTAVFLLLWGDSIIRFWTSGRIPYDSGIFSLILLSTVLTSIWQMRMIVLNATNSHMWLSGFYLLASGASIGIALAAAPWLNVFAPVIGMIGFEVIFMAACFAHFQAFKRQYT